MTLRSRQHCIPKATSQICTESDGAIELDLRSLKSVMQMECLRCKTPELVRKEIWTHVLAYNLVRTIIAQAAILRVPA